MPHEDMNGGSSGDSYDGEHERLLAEKPDRVLCSIKPMTEADAREFVIACNSRDDVSAEVVEHFAAEVRRLK